jgi:heptosyltransferase-2
MKITLKDSVAVRSPNWLGDAVISMPAVRNLKRFLGTRPLTVVTPQKLEGLWKEAPFVDRVIALDHPKKIISSARQIRKAGIQSIFLFPNSLRVASEAWTARVPQRIGKQGHSRRLLMTHLLTPVVFNGENTHQKYDYIEMVRQVTGIDDDTLPEVEVTSSDQRKEEIAIFPGAEYGAAKRWIEDRYIQVAGILQKETGASVCFHGAEKDREICESMASQVPGSRSEAGKTTLEDLIRRLRSVRLVLGNDSGAMHLAAFLRTPAVAIFGSTEPKLTGPMSETVTVIREHVVCSPCFLRECPLDFGCMKKISVDQVVTASLARYSRS